MSDTSKTRKLAVWLGVPLVLVGLLTWWLLPDQDPQGGASSWCDKMQEKPIPNSAGWTVTWHTTACTTLGTDVATYIYVHPTTSSEGRNSLVFRYFDAGGSAPEIRWVSNTDLKIKIDHVAGVTKQVKKIAGINISYDIGKQDYPPGSSDWTKAK
jgi:hypothetical protein